MITSIRFENFKVLKKFSISLKECNILVGINNSGKSTILDSLRILQGAYRFASRLKPTSISLPDGTRVTGWEIPENSIPITLDNVLSDLSQEPAIINYRFDNKRNLSIHFYSHRIPILSFDYDGKLITTAAAFRTIFNVKLAIIPTLSPFEVEEDMVEQSYLNRWAGSRRSSRLFRNIWYQDPEGFDKFQNQIESSWDGMSISLPEKLGQFDKKLSMFFEERRMPREICWAGFGFQVWLQLLTHIIKNKDADIIVIDEPEIYLHPDLQHKILRLLKETEAKVILATHSVEIINEADPSEVLLIDREYTSAKRLTSIDGIQTASDIIGSNQNVNLTKLARGKRILFVEGKDIKLLSKFAAISGNKEIFENNFLTVIPVEGFSQNDRVSGARWTFTNIMRQDVKIMALFDRDYRCEEEIAEFTDRLNSEIMYAHVLARKEIENYLLSVDGLMKSINEKIKERNSTCEESINELTREELERILYQLTEQYKTNVFSQIAAFKYRKIATTGKELASVIGSEQIEFDKNWTSLHLRFKIIPGKDFLSTLNEYLQEKYKIRLSHGYICNHLKKCDLDTDIINFFESIKRVSA